MALSHSPKIATDGLILCLDAANIRSYSGSGTTWADLSGRGNNGILTNGANYVTNNLGSINFDGTNDCVSIGDSSRYYITSTLPFTISAWIRHAGFIGTQYQRIVTLNVSDSIYTYGLALSNASNYPGFYIISNAVFAKAYTNFYPTVNVWGHICLTYAGGDPSVLSNFNLYWNTAPITLTLSTFVPGATARESVIGARAVGDSQLFRGLISTVQVYNRALSAAEIKTNFNALRGRYGI